MRLVCPNCDAEYEVPDDAIPEGGRDVQCSSCGHAWFQLRPEAEIAADEEAALFGDDLPPPEPAPAPEPVLEAQAEPVAPAPPPVTVTAPAGPQDDDEDELDAALATAEPIPAPPPAPPPVPAHDDAVLAILKEEAEREAEARRQEAQRAEARKAEGERQMEVQPDLGVEAAAAPLSPTQRRLAMLKGEDPDAPPAAPAKTTARRDLLPDVEEINSTLQPVEGQDDPDAEIDALPDLTRKRGGFRSGFFMMILLAVLAAAVYVTAPNLAEQFPAMKDALARYVSVVDSLRIWLNQTMDAATRALTGNAG